MIKKKKKTKTYYTITSLFIYFLSTRSPLVLNVLFSLARRDWARRGLGRPPEHATAAVGERDFRACNGRG